MEIDLTFLFESDSPPFEYGFLSTIAALDVTRISFPAFKLWNSPVFFVLVFLRRAIYASFSVRITPISSTSFLAAKI